jgi:N-ethylmaleimide reductase
MSLKEQPLFTSYEHNGLLLRNRIVMAAMTRARTNNPDLIPNDLQRTYYEQRASAGLILTESTWVSKKAIGFMNIPGIFSPGQTAGWKRVTESVHARNGKIFLQLAHAGAASHPDYHDGALPLGPSAINPQEKAFTPQGFMDTVTPDAYTLEQIRELIADYKQAAANAKTAGFDGVEIHALIYTLIPQFLSEATNQRTDEYGGSIENRSRLLFELLDAVEQVFPSGRIGMKFSPAAFNPGIIRPDHQTIATFDYILRKLDNRKIAFVELMAPGTDLKGTPIEDLHDNFFPFFRSIYKGTIMANGGFTFDTGNQIIEQGLADLVSFAAPFIANPNLPERWEKNLPLAKADANSYYAGGEKGYIDYPL